MAEVSKDEGPATARKQPRRPRQKRGVVRFEAILDAAHELLADRAMADLSLYDLASAVGCAPATVYHHFPSTNAVFMALAERYAKAWMDILDREEDPERIRTWHDIVRCKFEAALEYYNNNPQAMQVYLGLGTTREIRARDQELNRQLGAAIAVAIRRLFQLPEGGYLSEKFAYAIEISDVFWSLSYCRDGRISPDLAAESLIAVFSYLENFIPSHLPRVGIAGDDAAAGAL